MRSVFSFLALLPALVAQSAATFETASIHPTPEGPCEQSMIQPMTGGGLRTECMTLKAMMVWAYQVQNYQVSGGPAWVESANWNILARGPAMESALEYEKMTDDQRRQSSALVRRRLQALFADRFGLVVGREAREQPVYLLTAGKNGSKLKESEDQSKSGMVRGGRGLLIARGGCWKRRRNFWVSSLDGRYWTERV